MSIRKASGKITLEVTVTGDARTEAAYTNPFNAFALYAKTVLEEALDPPVQRVALYPGAQVAWDDCCGGQAWLRVVEIIPSGGDRRLRTACGPPLWQVTLGIGVLRCAAVVSDYGEAPSPEALTADTLQMLTDMSALQQAFECQIAPAVLSADHLRWVPLGPSGGCVGGEWLVTVRFDNCPCT